MDQISQTSVFSKRSTFPDLSERTTFLEGSDPYLLVENTSVDEMTHKCEFGLGLGLKCTP